MTDEQAKRKGLGRGLAALLGEDTAEDYAALDRARLVREVPIEQLQPSHFQPRRNFDEALDELAQSIREKGVLQPVLVRRIANGNTFEIVAGERRWRAAQKAQLHQIPVIIKELSDGEALELALVENLQRQDLNAIEEAGGYQRLIDEFEHTQEQLASVIGKSRSHIANTLRLLGLPDSVKKMIEDRVLTAGHARALLTAADPEAMARQIVDSRLNVRQVEDLVAGATPRRRRKTEAEKDPNTLALERDLSAAVGMKVAVVYRGAEGGELRVTYRNLEQLDELCRRLTRHRDTGRPPGSAAPEAAPGKIDAPVDIGSPPPDDRT